MTKRSIRIILILIAIAVALFVVFVVFKSRHPKPRSAYPPGTKIENPIAVPKDFPSEILASGIKFTHIDTVSYPNGKEDITVAYNSAKTINELFAYYSKLLKSKGWTIANSQFSVNSAVILAANSLNNKLFVTIVKNESGSTITFLYKK